MGECYFCPECGRIEQYCICDIEIEYLNERSEVFRTEYAFESVTDPQFSVYRTILPDYE